MEGYEIHNGQTKVDGEPFCHFSGGKADGCVNGNVFGTYLHGLFDSGELTEKLAQWLCERKGISYEQAETLDYNTYREEQYDKLAEGVRAALDMDAIYTCMGMVRK